MRKWVHTKLRILEAWFSLAKNRVYRPPKWRKCVPTKLRSLEREFQDSSVNVFSGRPNARTELTRCVVRVWPWPGHEFGLFAWPLNLDRELKLHFQVAIKEKVCSHEATYPWSMGFTSRKKSHFQAPKCRKWVRTKLGTLEREFKYSAVNVFSGRQNARSNLSRCLIRVLSSPLNLAANFLFSLDHELKLTFTGRHKGENVFTQSYELLWHGFHDSEKGAFSTAKMQKMSSHVARYPEREFQDSAVNVFSRRQNARSELTRCVVRVWPWPLTFDPGRNIGLFAWPLNFVIVLKLTFSGHHKGENVFTRIYVPLKHGFHDSAKIAFSSRQNAENVFVRSYVALNVSFNTRQ